MYVLILLQGLISPSYRVKKKSGKIVYGESDEKPFVNNRDLKFFHSKDFKKQANECF